jgi:hypothetical protein
MEIYSFGVKENAFSERTFAILRATLSASSVLSSALL